MKAEAATMVSRTYRAFVITLLIGVVCFTSIRLVNITVELEKVKKSNRLMYRSQSVHRTTIRTDLCSHTQYKYSSFPDLQKKSISCAKLFEGVKDDSSKLTTSNIVKNTFKLKSDQDVYNEAQNCEQFISRGGYFDHVISGEERVFPLAFSILLYKEVAQMVMLLKAIYRPQNLYCIHVDGNSVPSVHSAAKAVCDCFKNVFIVSKTENIVYSGFTRLQADLNCMKDLVSASRVQWKYFINLPSQQFPLKTNAELVKILTIYNGSNDIEGITGHRMLAPRFVYKHLYKEINGKITIIATNERNAPPPHNITVVKGSAYGIFHRSFVKFIFDDKRVQDFLEWCKSVLSPDEYFWATLHHSATLNAPGGYLGKPDDKPWLATYASWYPDSCAGRHLRGICLFSEGDLPLLASRREFFANKFIMAETAVALMCLEEWLHEKSMSQLPFDSYYYRSLPFIRH